MTVIKPADMKIGDVVAYYRGRGEHTPFGDMRVAKVEGNDLYLRRPYINIFGEAAYEELLFRRESTFPFVLMRRDAA